MAQESKLNIFVFLGPSLPVNEAKKILPQAHYLPPISCGDILRVLRLKPDIIAIIDGYFENTPAVWHKEILYALEKGITVIGGSSMGALRSSELNIFGLQTVGTIAENYLSGISNDDDEVALLHSPSRKNYAACSDPMVNIRATLKQAVIKNIIHKNTEEKLISITKNLFYPARTLDKIIQLGYQAGIEAQQLNQLKKWLLKNNVIDQKKQDAITVLSTIAEHQFIAQIENKFSLNHSAFFNALYKYIMCRPLNFDECYLPEYEKIASISRYLGNDYIMCRNLAYLLAACYTIITTDPEKDTKQEKKSEHFSTKTEDYVRYLLYLSGDYAKYRPGFEKFKSENPTRFRLYYWIAFCWRIVEKKILNMKLKPHTFSIQQYSNKFQAKMQNADIKKWISENDTDLTEYQFMLEALHRLDFFVLQNNLSCLNIAEKKNDIDWFSQALSLSGLSVRAKDLYDNKRKLADLIKAQSETQKDLNHYAQSLDFRDAHDFLQAASTVFADKDIATND